jgi:hypothetical protein
MCDPSDKVVIREYMKMLFDGYDDLRFLIAIDRQILDPINHSQVQFCLAWEAIRLLDSRFLNLLDGHASIEEYRSSFARVGLVHHSEAFDAIVTVLNTAPWRETQREAVLTECLAILKKLRTSIYDKYEPNARVVSALSQYIRNNRGDFEEHLTGRSVRPTA